MKPGDKVVVIKNINSHQFQIGDIVEIVEEEEFSDDGVISYKCVDEDDYWWLTKEEIELV